ncbi:hypothetical protein AX17_004610 [Amanita inopinata Kibby_2008]|nr:hypothetical protein AX17_004610 [Amanita inopinata Kibby_2008]
MRRNLSNRAITAIQSGNLQSITVIVAFSSEEAGHYLSVYKQLEHKPPDIIKERVDKDYAPLLKTALTSINKVNKTDVETLRTSLGSFANIANATPEQLQSLPGFGQVKVKNIRNAFEKPIRNNATVPLKSNTPEPPTLPDTNKSSQNEPMTDLLVAQQDNSPPWDIENDNLPLEPDSEFDIELDLN